MLLGGAYSTATRAGWKTHGAGTKFLYKNAGKNGTYGPVISGDLPVKATLVVDVPTAEAGQCGETDFTPTGCVIGGAGSTLKCK